MFGIATASAEFAWVYSSDKIGEIHWMNRRIETIETRISIDSGIQFSSNSVPFHSFLIAFLSLSLTSTFVLFLTRFSLFLFFVWRKKKTFFTHIYTRQSNKLSFNKGFGQLNQSPSLSSINSGLNSGINISSMGAGGYQHYGLNALGESWKSVPMEFNPTLN